MPRVLHENLKLLLACNQNSCATLPFYAEAAAGASSRVATPGSTLPSSNSSEAPPPVLQCVTLSSVPYFKQAVAVSPPPMTVTTPEPVTSTTLSIIDFVPLSKLFISNTPIGPFQMIVFDFAIAAAFFAIDSGPQSRPMKPAGIPSAILEFL